MTVYWLEQTASDIPDDNDWLGQSELSRLETMRFPKRRADWRLGRWTSKNAVVAYLDLPCNRRVLAAVEIRPSESGAPRVFLGDEAAEVSISLSHRADLAACVVSPPGSMLGCDLEIVEPRSQAFLEDYFTADEQQLISRISAPDRAKAVNLFWSAKESALKALGVGLRVNTRSVTVNFAAGLESSPHGDRTDYPENPMVAGRPQASRWQSLRVASAGDRLFHGWWQQAGAVVSTMVASPTPEQPIFLTTGLKAYRETRHSGR